MTRARCATVLPMSTDSSTPGLGDLFGLLGSNNPFAGISKSIAQFQRGVNQFLDTIEKFNETMEQLNGVAMRVNGLLDTVEEPIKAFVPQVTRTIRAADSLVEQLSGPIEKVAPSLNRFADTLSNPTLLALPADLGAFMETLSDLAHRLQPLGQLAESAGSMFGLRPLAALRAGGSRPAPPAPAPVPAQAKKGAPPKKTAARKTAARKTAAKTTAAKTTAAKKPTRSS